MMLRAELPGDVLTSPKSANDSEAKTSTCCTGCQGRSSSEASRIPAGPKRATGRIDVAVSNGTPTTATSTPSGSVTCGARANVRMPVKRGASPVPGGE